jgi:thiol-disulfide isomerase/thioredoxin
MLSDWAEKNLGLLVAILFVGSVTLVAGGLLAAKAVQEPPPAESAAISDTGVVLVVMQNGCGPCKHFEEKVAPRYKRMEQSATAPVRYIDISEVGGQKKYRLAGGVRGTPTILMINRFGREVGRSIGSPATSEDFAKLVDKHTERMNRRGT